MVSSKHRIISKAFTDDLGGVDFTPSFMFSRRCFIALPVVLSPRNKRATSRSLAEKKGLPVLMLQTVNETIPQGKCSKEGSVKYLEQSDKTSEVLNDIYAKVFEKNTFFLSFKAC